MTWCESRRWRKLGRKVAAAWILTMVAGCSGGGCAPSGTDAGSSERQGAQAPMFRNLGKRGDSDLPRRPG